MRFPRLRAVMPVGRTVLAKAGTPGVQARAIALAMTFIIIFCPLTPPYPLPCACLQAGARGKRIRDTFLFPLGYAFNSHIFRFMKEEFEEGSKGIDKSSLRALVRASSGSTIS
jgi:hypothetical protein